MNRLVAFGDGRVVLHVDREGSIDGGRAIDAVVEYACRRFRPVVVDEAQAAAPGEVLFHLRRTETHFELRTPEEVFTERDASQILERINHRLVFHLVAPSHSAPMVHSALLLRPDGAGLLFAGESGSGKSTLTAFCLTEGYEVVTDELTQITEGEDVVGEGFPRALHLKPGGASVLEGKLAGFAVLSGEAGTFIQPPASSREITSLGAIVFPKYAHDGEAESFTRVPAAQAARRLMGAVINARNLVGYGLGEISRVARRVPCYELVYSNFAFAGAALTGLGVRARARDEGSATKTQATR